MATSVNADLPSELITRIRYHYQASALVTAEVAIAVILGGYATAGTTREAAFRKTFAGDDILNGSGYRDALVAYAGNDLMRGGRGSDALNGGTGHDRVFGQTGNDLLVGGAGRDTLAGGGGNDRLRGGILRDVFVFGGADGRDRGSISPTASTGSRSWAALTVSATSRSRNAVRTS
jgi:Ca2+-binding RTX toxin-like protein